MQVTQKINKFINTDNLPYLAIIFGLLLIIAYLLSSGALSENIPEGSTFPAGPVGQ